LPLPFHRLVTGHDSAGKSIFILQDAEPPTHVVGSGGTRVTELWGTRSSPADNEGQSDVTTEPFRLPPQPNGSAFRIVEYPPDSVRVDTLKSLATHDDAGEGYTRDYTQRHPGFHRTNTIDYAIVLSGEIYALVDEGEHVMRAGDVLIQRGTNHAWSNRTSETAYVAFVLIDAHPYPMAARLP
jgi:hypothetical protein